MDRVFIGLDRVLGGWTESWEGGIECLPVGGMDRVLNGGDRVLTRRGMY